MAYTKFNIGDRVKLKSKWHNYQSLEYGTLYYVVEVQGSNIGLAEERYGAAKNYYSSSNFELVSKAEDFSGDRTKTGEVPHFNYNHLVVVDGLKGHIITRASLDDVQGVLRNLLKKNPEGSYVVYAPQFVAKFPDMPLELTPITMAQVTGEDTQPPAEEQIVIQTGDVDAQSVS